MKTGKSPEAGAAVIIGPSPETLSTAALTSVLCEVRDLLKSPSGSSLILDYRVRSAIFLIESSLGGLRHERQARRQARVHEAANTGELQNPPVG